MPWLLGLMGSLLKYIHLFIPQGGSGYSKENVMNVNLQGLIFILGRTHICKINNIFEFHEYV